MSPHRSEARVLILTALRSEARAIARQVRFRRSAPHSWMSPDAETVLLCIGPRATGIPGPNELAELLSARALVIVAGLAGGLDPALTTGAVVVDTSIRLEGGTAEQSAQRGHSVEPSLPPGAYSGRLHTAADAVTTPAAKRALFARTGARAVEMEQQIVVQALGETARLHRAAPARCLGVRAIIDAADQALPEFCAALINERGGVRIGATLRALLARPGRARDLQCLARQSHIALRAMSAAVAWFVEQETAR